MQYRSTDRQRETEKEAQTFRRTDKFSDRLTQRDTEKQRQADQIMDKWADRQTEGHSEKQRQRDRRTEERTNGQIKGQPDDRTDVRNDRQMEIIPVILIDTVKYYVVIASVLNPVQKL